MDGYVDDHDHNNDDTNSIGSWKDGVNELTEEVAESSSSMSCDRIGVSTTPVESTKVRMSWADMAQDDLLEADEDSEMVTRSTNGIASSGERIGAVARVLSKPVLAREQRREYIRFTNVKRNKDFICFERIKEHTYTAPTKWMRGKGRVTTQFALKAVGEGEFNGPFPIALPVGSVLVFNGNGADVAMHCVPAVPTKRISIIFRKMDESKWPVGFVPEPDLQGLQPLPYKEDKSKCSNPLKSNLREDRQTTNREDRIDKVKRAGVFSSGPRLHGQIPEGPLNRR